MQIRIGLAIQKPIWCAVRAKKIRTAIGKKTLIANSMVPPKPSSRTLQTSNQVMATRMASMRQPIILVAAGGISSCAGGEFCGVGFSGVVTMYLRLLKDRFESEL